MKKSKIVGTIISAIIIVVGVFAVVYNVVIVYNSDLKYIKYKTIEGNVSTVQSSFADGESYYRAVYSYSVGGAGYTVNSGYTDDVDKYKIGDTAKIRYNSDTPSVAFIVSDDRTMNYLYLGISCIVLIIGIKIFDKQLRLK